MGRTIESEAARLVGVITVAEERATRAHGQVEGWRSSSGGLIKLVNFPLGASIAERLARMQVRSAQGSLNNLNLLS